MLIGKQFLYVERYMKLLAPKLADDDATRSSPGYFANFMVEVSREHKDPEQDPEKIRSTPKWIFAPAPPSPAISTSTTRTWATRTIPPSC